MVSSEGGGELQHSCELLCCIHFSLIRWGQTGGWFFIKLHFISLKHRLVQYITVSHVLIFCWLMCISKIYHLHWHATSAYWGLMSNVRNFVLTFRELQILFWTIDLAFIQTHRENDELRTRFGTFNIATFKHTINNNYKCTCIIKVSASRDLNKVKQMEMHVHYRIFCKVVKADTYLKVKMIKLLF